MWSVWFNERWKSFHRHSINSSVTHTKDSRGDPKQCHIGIKLLEVVKYLKTFCLQILVIKERNVMETIAEALLESLLHDKVTDETRNHGKIQFFAMGSVLYTDIPGRIIPPRWFHSFFQ